MKDLFKPGRPIDEYLNDDGTLKRNCLTCINRHSIGGLWGGYLCKDDQQGWNNCTDRGTNIEHKNWEARVDGLIKEEDMAL